jgi:ORF6N domain
MGNESSEREDLHSSIVQADRIEQTILLIRGEKVILDVDLAALYGVTTKQLNQQVKRNQNRFPPDFMFKLLSEEKKEVVTNCDHLSNMKYFKGLPYAFTEHGAIMAASVLNTPRAVEMSVFVVRAFVRLRTFLAAHKELAEKLAELERRLASHDEQIVAIIDAIKRLMGPPARPDAPASDDKRRIGFHADGGGPAE